MSKNLNFSGKLYISTLNLIVKSKFYLKHAERLSGLRKFLIEGTLPGHQAAQHASINITILQSDSAG